MRMITAETRLPWSKTPSIKHYMYPDDEDMQAAMEALRGEYIGIFGFFPTTAYNGDEMLVKGTPVVASVVLYHDSPYHYPLGTF